ncbi:MAG: molecular chaperone TorD family protein [Ancalomicrobiaceae bacterium]|nr:molecular chaperone TorD family protein [Ancalomicrobiaceae bacterium]
MDEMSHGSDSAARAASRLGTVETLSWLACLFADAPSEATIAAARGGPAATVLGGLAADPDLAPGVGRLVAALDASMSDVALAARLAAVFGVLFSGVGGRETVSPYESVQRTGRLFQAPARDMARLLAAHDLAIADGSEAPDHLSVEVALLAQLTATDDPDRAGLAARLDEWLPEFRDLCLAKDPTGYFAGAAELLAALLAREESRANNQQCDV